MIKIITPLLLLIFATNCNACGKKKTVLYRTGSSTYNIQSDYSIEEIIVKTVASARDALSPLEGIDIWEVSRKVAVYYLREKLAGNEVTLKGVAQQFNLGEGLGLKFKALYINDERVEVNKDNIIRAIKTVASFILDLETDTLSSVSYSYSFNYDGMPIERFAYITDNSVYLNTVVRGGLPAPVTNARIQIWARENNQGSLIQTKLTVTVRDKQRLLNRIANKVVGKETAKFHAKGFARARGFINSSERGDSSARIATSIIDVLSEGGFRVRGLLR